MAGPVIENRTAFAFEALFLSDEEGRPLCVPVVQGTYLIRGSALVTAEHPLPVCMVGQFWGDPETTSIKYEPVFAFMKPATDVVLIGHAHAPERGTTEMQVGIRVGPVQKVLRVVGDRYLVRRLGAVHVTKPEPFERIPLVYERSFGGWDRRDPNPQKHRFEPRNPVGTAFRHVSVQSDDQFRLPNLEDYQRPYRSYGDTPTPAGFGFIAPHWQPRASFAGTYDEAWDKRRKPLLPKDFDRRFFNAASPGLIAPGYLSGNEPVVVIGMSPEGRMAFQLPGVSAPLCRLELRGRSPLLLQTALDTVLVNVDERLVLLTWRAFVAVRNGPHDLVSIEVRTDPSALPKVVA